MNIRLALGLGAMLLQSVLPSFAAPSQAPATPSKPAAATAKPTIAQRSFDSPDAAVKALVSAVQKDDIAAIMAIFGPLGKDIVSSGDPVRDRRNRLRFIEIVQQKCDLVMVDKTRYMVRLGSDDWPFPIPIVKRPSGWMYDTPVGLQELLNRQVGSDELAVFDTCHIIVDAQRAYKAREGAYATRFFSTQGTHDGLYWPEEKGQLASPLGPLVAAASVEGYAVGKQAPFHGYHFRMLEAQGASAPGGARSYIVDGKMTGGFAVVAWPANPGVSGVYTFIINQDGVVFQKKLGAATAAEVAKMTEYNPDDSWTPMTDLHR